MTKLSLLAFVVGRHPITNSHMTFNTVNKDRQGDQTRCFKIANQLGNVWLLGNNVLAIKENSYNRFCRDAINRVSTKGLITFDIFLWGFKIALVVGMQQSCVWGFDWWRNVANL